MEAVYDGYISKYINRKASEPMARLLARTRLTPNQATRGGAFGIALLSCISFILGHNIIYIGDGLSDLEAARNADYVFATGHLLRLLSTDSIACSAFSDFYDLLAPLQSNWACDTG